MAAERLFSLELLVEWVRLEAAPPPGPAVAFRLLDFPPLLVRAPASPAALPGGALGFGRGKACVFRLRPAALRRPRLRAALLQLPAAPGPPAPRLLGACDVPLPAARGPGSRGTFALLDPAGRRVGDLALFCRLTELGGRARDPDPAAPAPDRSPWDSGDPALGVRGPQGPTDLALDAPEPADPAPGRGPQDAALDPAAPREGAPSPSRAGSTENSKPGPSEAAGSSASTVSTSSEEDAELDLETNTFCPPPLYYTHLTQERARPAGVKITIEPQRTVPEELGDALPEKVLVNPPTHLSPPKGTDSAAQETAPVLLSPPGSQDGGAVNQTTCHPQTEQNTINAIRQLPLLNALLIELSLLYNQPVASPTHVHPHLAWLYRTEDKKVPESCAKSTCQPESKEKFSVGDHEKSVSVQCKKNQVENLKKGKYFENSSNCQKRVTRGRLLYGLTNTLRLRLKQTNPDMLIVHEKREEYRKMQAQRLSMSTKLRIPSSKVLSFAEQSQKPHQLPRDEYLDSDASSAENSDTSRQISEVFDESSTTKETKLKSATEIKTIVCGGNRTSSGSLGRIVSPADSIIPERLTPTNISRGELETRVQSPCVFQQDAVTDKIENKEIDDWQVRTTDNDVPAEISENSCHESISELKYSDDFTSPCYSEDFYTTEETSKSLQTRDSSPRAEISHNSKSSGARPPLRKSSGEKSSILSPPFSAGSPVLSQKRSHVSKTRDKIVEMASSNSTSNLSSFHWTEEKESHVDQNSRHNSKGKKRGQDFSMKLKAETDCKWSEKSPSPRTSQVSSYLPSNLSELGLNVLDGSTSDHFEEDDIGSLRISKQYKDICELVINKLPGYTV